MSWLVLRKSSGEMGKAAIAVPFIMALCALHVSSAEAQTVSYSPGSGVLQLNNSGSNYAANLGTIEVYVASPSYLPASLKVINGDWGKQIISTTDANNNTTGDLMDWYYNTSTNGALPPGVYTLAQLPTGMSALDFGYSYSYNTGGPHGSQVTINYGAGDTSSGTTGAVVFGSVLGGAGTGSVVNVATRVPSEIDWTGPTLGSWGTSADWTVPGSSTHRVPLASDTPTFNSAGGTITLDGSQSAGSLWLDSTNSYTIAPGTGGTLSLSNTATIFVDAGTHTIAAPLALAGSLDVAIVPSAGLIITGAITGGAGLVLSGGGGLVLASANTFAGGVDVEFGTLTATISGAIPKGDSLTVGAGSALIFDSSVSAGVMSPQVADGVTAVPEPGTMALLSTGTLLFAAGAWRRRTARS
jgi:hypothetical protein